MASSNRPETPSLSKMWVRWFLTVFSLMPRRSAISLFAAGFDDQPDDLSLAVRQPEIAEHLALRNPELEVLNPPERMSDTASRTTQ